MRGLKSCGSCGFFASAQFLSDIGKGFAHVQSRMCARVRQWHAVIDARWHKDTTDQGIFLPAPKEGGPLPSQAVECANSRHSEKLNVYDMNIYTT